MSSKSNTLTLEDLVALGFLLDDELERHRQPAPEPSSLEAPVSDLVRLRQKINYTTAELLRDRLQDKLVDLNKDPSQATWIVPNGRYIVNDQEVLVCEREDGKLFLAAMDSLPTEANPYAEVHYVRLGANRVPYFSRAQLLHFLQHGIVSIS